MISNRLKSLTKYINSNDSVIDIGCDHALLDIYLVKNNIVNKLIVSDISNNALNQGIENIKKYNLSESIKTRCGNGLEVLIKSDNIDTVILSGMGANTILSILDNEYLKNIKKLVIQSNKDYELLRRNIVKQGYSISDEEVVCDNNKIYINIVFVRGIGNYTDTEYKYGISGMKNKEVYYDYLINKYESILLKINNEDIKNELVILKELKNNTE